MTRIAIGVMLTVAAFAQSSANDALKLNDEGNTASDVVDYAGAATKYQQAIDLWRTLGPEYKAHLAASLMNLGTVLCGEGKRAEGAKIFTEALALHRITLGVNNHRTLMNMTLLASDYLMLGELQKAETILDEALPLARINFPNDIQLARCLEIQSGVLNRHGTPLSSSQLARRSFMTAQSMHEVIHRLEQDGLIERNPHPDHGRKLPASLTAKGRRVLAACEAAVADFEATMLNGFSKSDRTTFLKIVKSAVQNLGGGFGDGGGPAGNAERPSSPRARRRP